MTANFHIYCPSSQTQTYLSEISLRTKSVSPKTPAKRTFDVRKDAIEEIILNTEKGSFSSYLSFNFTDTERKNFDYFTLFAKKFLKFKANQEHEKLYSEFSRNPKSFLNQETLTVDISDEQSGQFLGLVKGLCELAAPLELAKNVFTDCDPSNFKQIEGSHKNSFYWITPSEEISTHRPNWDSLGYFSTAGNLIASPEKAISLARSFPPDRGLFHRRTSSFRQQL